eukprot:s3790_g2.t1
MCTDPHSTLIQPIKLLWKPQLWWCVRLARALCSLHSLILGFVLPAFGPSNQNAKAAFRAANSVGPEMKMEMLRNLPLLPLVENDKEAAKRVLERRAKLSQRWKPDRSAFTALHLDVCKIFKNPNADLVDKQVAQRNEKKPARDVSALSLATTTADASTEAPATPSDLSDSMTPTSTSAEQVPSTNFVEVRRQLLAYRNQVSKDDVPEYVVEVAPVPVPVPPSKDAGLPFRQQSEPIVTSKSSSSMMRRQMSAQVERPPPKKAAPLVVSANAWRPAAKKSPEDDLKRQVQGLLNKICPENVASIIEKIAAIEVQDIKQLEAIIELMFKKAITEPHYCETYADMVFSLKAVYPSFPSPDGGKPITFKGLVLNICQNEFEELLASNDISAEQKAKLDEEELEYMRKKRKDRMRANMKFIGHLFLRQLLSAKVIGSVICELVLCEQVDDLPEEHALECACELLLAIGYTMENMIAGQSALTSVCGRLKELMKRQLENGKGAYCKRVQFMIQDVLDTRAAGWQKKVFKAAAKTKEEIRLDQEKEMSDKAKGKASARCTSRRLPGRSFTKKVRACPLALVCGKADKTLLHSPRVLHAQILDSTCVLVAMSNLRPTHFIKSASVARGAASYVWPQIRGAFFSQTLHTGFLHAQRTTFRCCECRFLRGGCQGAACSIECHRWGRWEPEDASHETDWLTTSSFIFSNPIRQKLCEKQCHHSGQRLIRFPACAALRVAGLWSVAVPPGIRKTLLSPILSTGLSSVPVGFEGDSLVRQSSGEGGADTSTASDAWWPDQESSSAPIGLQSGQRIPRSQRRVKPQKALLKQPQWDPGPDPIASNFGCVYRMRHY